MTIDCPYLRSDGACDLATYLAGKPAAANPSACKACLSCNTPKQINNVVVSLALGVVRGDKTKASQILRDYGNLVKSVPDDSLLRQIIEGTGVGSQMWKLLSGLRVKHKSSCFCLQLAKRMNELGPDGCSDRSEELIEEMRKNQGSYGWAEHLTAGVLAVSSGLAFKLNPLDPIPGLLNEAIRLAKEAETCR